jgi:hypothetical protein
MSRFFTKMSAATKVVIFSVVFFGVSANATHAPLNHGYPVQVGTSCMSGEANHICLGLKYVVYKDGSGAPVMTEQEALENVEHMNALHAKCGIGFQIEEFTVIDPAAVHLPFNIANLSDLDGIRSTFGEPSRLLVVTTGKWNRAGTLGASQANAWTSMPGSPPYGAVLESTVANYSYIFAHEMGHYLNLDHFQDSSNLMNPVIYSRSTSLTDAQCSVERDTAEKFWAQANRAVNPLI